MALPMAFYRLQRLYACGPGLLLFLYIGIRLGNARSVSRFHPFPGPYHFCRQLHHPWRWTFYLFAGCAAVVLLKALHLFHRPEDEHKAKTSSEVSGFIMKPLTKDMLEGILQQYF